MNGSLVDRVRSLILRLWREVAKFGVVGGVAFIIDSAIFLWLLGGPMAGSELKAKVVAGVIATVFSWVANRYWTFRHHRTTTKVREVTMFMLMNAIGLGIQTGCVGISKYILEMDSVTQIFIAGNVIGLVLATTFRFVAYKFWVFTGTPEPAAAGTAAGAEGRAHSGATAGSAQMAGAEVGPADEGPHMLSDRELMTGDVPVIPARFQHRDNG